MITTFILILIGFVIVASIVAVETKGLLSIVICVGAAGLAMSVIFLLLGAPDLAITQVVVEVLCLVWLIRATDKHRDITVETTQDRFVVAVGIGGACIFITLATTKRS